MRHVSWSGWVCGRDNRDAGRTGCSYGQSRTNEEWFPHRRDDGEVVGYIKADGALWCGLDILGRPVVESVEWLEAEEALEDRGLQMLLEPHVPLHEVFTLSLPVGDGAR